MVRGRGVVDDADMTESNAEQTSAPPPPASAAGATAVVRLRRRASDRVAAGVASGIADYLNVDPILIRVALVGLVLFNGAGFFIYLLAWLFIPVEGRDSSIVEDWIQRLGVNASTAGTVAWVILAIVGTMWLFDSMQPNDGVVNVRPMVGFVVALLVIAGGILLVRRTAAGGPSGPVDRAVASGPAYADAPAPPARPAVVSRPRVPRERSPLGFYVLGLLLLTIGAMTAVDGATTADILPGQYAGVALAIVGAGLVIGAWWGRARWLIFVGLLLIPIAVAMSFVTAPLEGGWGDRRESPTTAAELDDEYRLAGGELTIDLSDLPRSTAERHIAASIGIGRLLVIVPDGAGVDVTTEIGAGTSNLLGTVQEGTGLTDRNVREGTGGTFVLDLEAGIGSVRVRTATEGD